MNGYPYKRKNGCVWERKDLFYKEKIVDFVKSDPARAKCISVAFLSGCVQKSRSTLCERDFFDFFNNPVSEKICLAYIGAEAFRLSVCLFRK